MRPWMERNKEIAYLLNPAFCSIILISFIDEYNSKSNEKVDFSVLYLVLPIVLSNLSETYNAHSLKFLNWISNNKLLFVNFASSVKDYLSITNETIEFLLNLNIISVDSLGKITLDGSNFINNQKNNYIDNYKNKSKILGRMFGKVGNQVTIFSSLGVRP